MNEIINKTDGTILKWSKTPDNNYFCLLYSDNKNNYSFTPTTNLNCKLFMIGGGGAGGYYFGGGGGAGAAYYNDNFTFKKGITYNFTIGNGGTCDIDNIDSLFTQGLSLNIYNNVNIDFNNISFSLDDYSSLNINNTGLIQNFIVNNCDNNITIPNSIWNNNTFYIWSGYIIPSTNDEYIKISINTNINTAIWIDNYIYTNDNALILNTNNNYLNDVKNIKIDPKKYYNIKIIAYCNNNSSNNNFNVEINSFGNGINNLKNNCSLYNYNKNNEKYLYLNATETTLNFNDNSLDNPMNTLICNGGGNGGCGFYNHNDNLDGGCGGGSGINKKNGKTLVNTSIYKGTDGAVGSFCGGGGGIQSAGKDNVGGDGMILDWFDNKLKFGCGGNGGNYKDNRNLGYGCGGNGGDCCYYSKEIINNNGKNGCVLIYINSIKEGFSNFNRNEEVDTTEKFYNYISDINGYLLLSQVYLDSINKITNCTTKDNNIGIDATQAIFDSSRPSNNASTTYAGYFKKNETSFPQSVNNTVIPGYYSKNDYVDGIDNFFNYFKYNPSYIYDMLCFHKCLIGLYKILYYQFGNYPYDTSFYNNLKITLDDTKGTGYSLNVINLANIFNIDINQFKSTLTPSGNDGLTDVQYGVQYKTSAQYINYFYGTNASRSAKSLNMSQDCFDHKYNDDNSVFPILPYYNVINNTNGKNTLGDLIYIIDYLTNDFNNTYDLTGTKNYKPFYTNGFISDIPEFLNNSINAQTVKNAYTRISNEINLGDFKNETRHIKELKLLYLTIFRDVLEPSSMSKICGRLYFFAHQFNLIIINLNLQYGFYRHIFGKLSSRPYIKYNNPATIKYFRTINTGELGDSSTPSGTINVTDYIKQINYSNLILSKIYELFQNFKIKYSNTTIYNANIENDVISKVALESQLKLNKTIKMYNDELEIYNTTLNIYKAVVVIFIVLLIVIIYIFTLNSNVLDRTSKVSVFIILACLILGISIYFAYNNNILYENFSNKDDNDNNDNNDNKDDNNEAYKKIGGDLAIEGFDNYGVSTSGVDVISDCHMYPGNQTLTTISDYKAFGNAPNFFQFYGTNGQGMITNFIYLAGIINDSGTTRQSALPFSSSIIFDEYNKSCNKNYDYLRYYIASTYNIMNNSSNIVNDTKSIIAYKNKRDNFYKNRKEFYINAIQGLKNTKYVYYYMSILYAFCLVLLLLSLIVILIFGNSTESIILTSIFSFLVVLIIVYYIYFKLHQRTRMMMNKNYWAYNNPSEDTFKDNK